MIQFIRYDEEDNPTHTSSNTPSFIISEIDECFYSNQTIRPKKYVVHFVHSSSERLLKYNQVGDNRSRHLLIPMRNHSARSTVMIGGLELIEERLTLGRRCIPTLKTPPADNTTRSSVASMEKAYNCNQKRPIINGFKMKIILIFWLSLSLETLGNIVVKEGRT